MIEYRPGDVLLLPKDKALGPYLWIKEQFGEKVADFLAFQSNLRGMETSTSFCV